MAKNDNGLMDQPNIKPMDRSYQAPQAPSDRHESNYDNDVPLSTWLRNGDATTKPGFDKRK